MNELNVTAGDVLHKVYVISGQEAVPQRILVERDARADILVAVLPGVSCDIGMEVELLGEGAQANIYGAYVCGAEEKVRIAVDMYHKVPHCNSRQLFKGIAGGTSRVDFYGKIIVAQDAQRTEAYQENHNILLTDGAKVDTKPQLEIYADDVKCSHGATVGQLDSEAVLYMRQRGLSLQQAKRLQIEGFVSDIVFGSQQFGEYLAGELTAKLEKI